MENHNAWDEGLPEEIMLMIFKLVTNECGPVPFLCRAAQVCRYWRDIAYHWDLWQHVDLSSGWIHKNPVGLTVMCESRFGDETVSLSLEAWFKLTDQELVTIAESCPFLRELDISSCQKLSGNAMCVIADHFSHLKSIRLGHMAPLTLGHKALSYFAERKGSQLQKFILSNADVNKNFQKNVHHIMMFCPQLLHLEISHLNFLDGELLTLYVANLQFGCPMLEVLNLSGTLVRFYNPREDEIKCPGFSKLQEYYAPVDHVPVDDISFGSMLILRHSFQLKKLILGRNQHNLDLFPATKLEHLKLPEDSKKSEIFHQVRWRDSLTVLDMSWIRSLSRSKIDNGLKNCFNKGKPAFVNLKKVYLCGTQVSWHGLCYILEQCKTLKLLNCTLCCNVPKFWARELSGDLLALLYKLVTEELSAQDLSHIQAEFQLDGTASTTKDENENSP